MSSIFDDIKDVRQRASAILSEQKLVLLEEAGMTVIEQKKLELYQRIARNYGQLRKVAIAMRTTQPGGFHFINAGQEWVRASRALDQAYNDLEAFGK